MPVITTFSSSSAKSFGVNAFTESKFNTVTGQQEFTTPGTYSWIAPKGVKFVSVVCVGAGGYSNGGFYTGLGSGGGGGLGWKNDIPVTPGASYTVKVGEGNVSPDSYFISATLVKGGGTLNYNGGTYVGDGGGNGGNGGRAYPSGPAPITTVGGGGAGGYTGNGSNGNSSLNGSGGGGAGGSYHDNAKAGHGGGVGIYGQGSNGVWFASSGTVDSANGGKGSLGAGTSQIKTPGGGAGLRSPQESEYYAGGDGAVRIIWGVGTRAFPSTNTGDL